MQLKDLKRKNPNKRSTKVGRGGKRGKTSGRGHKGQNARAGNSKRPEIRDIIKKVPKLRGHGKHGNKNKAIIVSNLPVNLSLIDKKYSDGEKVNPTSLLEKNIIKKQSGKLPRVKVLGNGEISKKVTIADCMISRTALKKIESAGGSVEEK